MKIINNRQEPEILLATSQHSPMRFLIKAIINFAWILFGFRVLFYTGYTGAIPFYAPFLAIVGPSLYCFWRNWTKFHTCIQVYTNKIVLYPEDAYPITLNYLQVQALILKKGAIEILSRAQRFPIPIYADYTKVVESIIVQYHGQTGKKLILVDERAFKEPKR